jgi:hypothetical protein
MRASLAKRLYIYQKERFPLAVHIPLIAAFSFSAIGFSQASRNIEGFVQPSAYLCCVFTNVTLFFILRVCDETKDKKDDALYRTYLPVPRGLVSLSELSIIAFISGTAAILLNVFLFPSLLPFLGLTSGFLFLMRYEFFMAGWLRNQQVAYITSHMVIIPLADMYASGYDWKLSGASYPPGMILFFLVSYLNGIVLEIGRKLRVEETEEYGVVSYTKLWGPKKAPLIWLSIVSLNGLLALLAVNYAGYDWYPYLLIGITLIVAAWFALKFIINPDANTTKTIEIISLAWALIMYLSLGALPLLIQLFS